MRIAIGIEYAGNAFEGWQTQPHGRTVQDALEKALAQIAQAPLKLVCAGRTDTGVHASMQVAHFDTTARRPLEAWVRGVNSHLPDSVSVPTVGSEVILMFTSAAAASLPMSAKLPKSDAAKV